MCFSMEASFTAALVLGIAGVITIKKTSSPSQLFLAAIPLLFAIQQFSEGLIWFQLTHHTNDHELLLNAERSFLTFAFLVWPIWLPLSFALIEPLKWRRIFLFTDLTCGVILSLLNFTYAIKEEIGVKIVNHSLQYTGQVPEQLLIYPLIVMLPMFLSSIKHARIFGTLTIIGFVIAEYSYTTNFASVWCFFSAIVSVFIYMIIKEIAKDQQSCAKGR